MPAKRRRPPHPPSESTTARLMTVVEAVAGAWHRAHRSAAPEIPLSTVAVLALLTPPTGQLVEAADVIRGLDREQFHQFLRTHWTIFVRARPDLLPAAWPLVRPWFDGDPPDAATVDAARSVAHAALDAGQLPLTGTTRRRDIDLFGPLLVELRADGARLAAGQFYTPADIADTLATAVLHDAEPGNSVMDPAIGTGGLFRAAAQTLRAQGTDPASLLWFGGDVDETAIACAAVNAVLWGLGRHVVLGVGDSLTDSWQETALAQRREVLQIARQLRAAALAADLIGALTRQVDSASTERGAPDSST
ncbi:site-specific DNA-methyltransferase (adenine-specific) [Frankia sp. AiPs1]|uniref:N-6 DNA methylase n=1 Tax=Frankia sp. AiPa1 TaxID=573492 RepID=UPI00202AD9FA|nr:N-6 DNA methylase [Frankia sp. AiPa1]MCL9758635.1 SAM-dependent methyltransferase [Frankia sp. AiPa1]